MYGDAPVQLSLVSSEPATVRVPLIRVSRHRTVAPVEVRAMIPVLALVNRAISNIYESTLDNNQVRCLELLLRKVLPDCAAVVIQDVTEGERKIEISFPDLGTK